MSVRGIVRVSGSSLRCNTGWLESAFSTVPMHCSSESDRTLRSGVSKSSGL